MASTNRTPNSERQNFRQIEGDSWSNRYLPVISAGVVMAVLLFLAVSCSKKSDNPGAGARISAPPAPAVEPAAATTAAMPVEAAKKAVKKHRPTIATYVNGTYGVSFSYPRKYSLEAGSKQSEMPLDAGFVKPGAVEIASVNMPDSGYPDTDFSSALVNLSVNQGLSREECAQFAETANASANIDGQADNPSAETGDASASTRATPAEEAQQPASVKLGSNEFSETEQMKQAGARQSDVKYFHVFRNGACYEFALDIETSRKADEDLAQVDRGQVFKQLGKILTTAKIKETELPGMAKADRPDAASRTQPSTPAPAAGEPLSTTPPPAGGEGTPPTPQTEKSQLATPERR